MKKSDIHVVSVLTLCPMSMSIPSNIFAHRFSFLFLFTYCVCLMPIENSPSRLFIGESMVDGFLPVILKKTMIDLSTESGVKHIHRVTPLDAAVSIICIDAFRDCSSIACY